VGDALLVRAQAAGQKGLELVQRVRPDVPFQLCGDPGRLKQILINLVGNAIKFTSEGEIEVDVQLKRLDSTSAELQFSVRDTGIGIPADKQSTIFESFSQADSSTTRKYGGTGLGLSISAQLADLMGGRIWVESEPGRGSTFHFTAIFATSEQTAAQDRRWEPLRDRSVLIVDHNPAQRIALADMLSSFGLQTAIAADASAALQSCRDAHVNGRPFELAILDAGLPGTSAATLAAKIRSVSGHAELGVIALAGLSEQSEAGASAESNLQWLSKPAKHAQLGEALLNIVDPHDTNEPTTDLSSVTNCRPLRILLVEDGFINREVALGFLEIGNHQVSTAENGIEALEALESQDFDVILMDVEMPEMDGMEASRIIREREAGTGEHIPIIAMTAHAIDAYRERCTQAGMDGYVTKPIDPHDLFAALASVTAQARRTSEEALVGAAV